MGLFFYSLTRLLLPFKIALSLLPFFENVSEEYWTYFSSTNIT